MFVPQAGGALSVTLPGEMMRAVVTRVLDRDTVIVEIGQPMMRSHSYRVGDLVAVRRTATALGETWQAIEERRTLPDMQILQKTAKKPLKSASAKSRSGKISEVDTTLLQQRAKAKR